MNRLGIDYGLKRVGVAIARDGLRIAHALAVLDAEDDLIAQLQQLVDHHSINEIVVGFPRSLNGNETEQTKLTSDFIDELKSALSVPVIVQDEAGTTARAQELGAVEGVDAAAAAIILQDYLETR